MTREQDTVAACADVLSRLSSLGAGDLDGSTLARFLLQHGPSIGTAVQIALADLARAELARSSSLTITHDDIGSPSEEADAHARQLLAHLAAVLTRALSRGDPSLARVLLRGTPSLVDLAISTGTLRSNKAQHHASAERKALAQLGSAFHALMDPHLAVEILQAIHTGLRTAVLDQFQQQVDVATGNGTNVLLVNIQRRARMLALLLRCLPAPSSAARKGDAYLSILGSLAQDLGTLHDVILPVHSEASPGNDEGEMSTAVLAAQVHVRDAALALLMLFRPKSSSAASPAIANIIALINVNLSNTSSHPSLVDILRARLLEASSVTWDELMVALKAHASVNTDLAGVQASLLADSDRLGSALAFQSSRRSTVGAAEWQLAAAGSRAGKGKAKAENISPINPDLLATVQSVLPHLDTAQLERRLRRPKYAQKSADQVIDLLLESTSDADESSSTDEDDDGGEEVYEAAYEPPAPLPVRNRRANIFDDADPVDLTKFRWKSSLPSLDRSDGGPQTANGLHTIPSDLKASVLARVAAQQREEAEMEEEEWELEHGIGGGMPAARGVREAGFEEELDEGADEDGPTRGGRGGEAMDWVGRRGMTVSLASSGPNAVGRVPNAREWRRKFEDESDDEDEGEDENANSGGGPSTAGTVPPNTAAGPSSSSTSTGAASERAAEAVLTRYYAQHGSALFARDPALRKGNNPLGIVRRQLLAELERETGKAWDSSLVESWGTMFERNPRKDRLLARSTDLLGPNPNRPASGAGDSAHNTDSEAEGRRRFGPDRGRGGRILRGGGARGRGRGGASEGPDGSHSRVSGGGNGGGQQQQQARGGGAGRGQHSGSNRAARQKEKRGSSARFRGGRGGGMARSGAFPAGGGGD
ncbi:hypothetical protein V8E36_008682 [Tilletia maclaganii]